MNIKRFKNTVAVVLMTALMFSMTACNFGKNAENTQKAFDDFTWRVFEENVTADTITLHYTLADPKGYGIEAPEVTLGEVDFSEETMKEEQQEIKELLKEMEGFNYKKLTKDQQLTYDILKQDLQLSLEFYDFVYLYEPFAYTSGLQANIPITLSEYKFYSEQDVEDYLTILELIPDYFNDYLEFERVKSEKGLFMNENCAEEVIRQCSDMIADPKNIVLIPTFESRIEKVEGLSEAEKGTYIEENYNAVMEYVIPAYENTIDAFEELKTTGENDLGLSYLENGEEYYRYLLAADVGTDKTPEEVIKMLDEALDETMSELYTAVMADYEGYLAYFDAYETLYENNQNDPAQTIRFFEKAMGEQFPELPQVEFTVTPVHESLESSVSPAFYMLPAIDRYEDNSIHINEGSTGVGALWATLAHEGIPGHMFQNVYFLSQNPEPIRKLLSFGGYDEGWATYVEMMSYEYYDFEKPLYGDMERINAELNLLISARVEIGVNYEGWTLEETESYLADMGMDDSVAQELMDYVIAEPANYQMYCTGWLEFEQLRDFAESKLGNRFDEAEFHEVLLSAGPCQFNILRERVIEYTNQ